MNRGPHSSDRAGISELSGNRGRPQTSQGYGGQDIGVAGSGIGAQYGVGPTGGNSGGPQTDQSSGPVGQGANRY